MGVDGEFAYESFFRAVVENAIDGIALVDADGAVVYVSPSAARVLGGVPAKPTGTRIFEGIHPDDAELARRALSRVLDGTEDEMAILCRTRQGDRAWRTIEARLRRAPDVLPKRTAIIGARDVTARQRAADRLAMQLAVMRVLANATTIADAAPLLARALVEHLDWDFGAVWVVDDTGDALDCAGVWHREAPDLDAFASATRAVRVVRGDGFLGSIWGSAEPKWIDDVAAAPASSRRAAEAARCDLHAAFGFPIAIGTNVVGAIEMFSRRTARADAELAEVMAVVGGLVGQFVNHRRSEAQRDRALAEVKALLRTLPDLFFRLDSECRFMDYSAGTEADLYAPPEVFMGKRIRDVIPAPIALAMEEAIAQTHRTSTIATLEYELPIGNARQYFELRCVPFVEGQTIAICRNITDRRRAAQAEQRQRESQKMEAVGRLAGGIAHDFNNLLMAILGYASLVAERLGSGHAVTPQVAEIRRAGERAVTLTKQLLAFSRRQMLVPRVMEVGAVVRDMHGMLTRVIGEDVSIDLRIAESSGNVRADPSQLEQVLMNLAINARDAMPGGGTLSIHVSPVDVIACTAERLAGIRPGAYVTLTVSDTGLGMDAETLSHIFEPFFTTKPVGSGTGLGLSTVYGIVEQSNGHIRVESTPGRGTVFTVYLPRVDEPAEELPTHRGERVPRGTETILVVEDEPAVRSLVVEVLRGLGYRVLQAETAADAFEVLRSYEASVHLLLTDLVMPGGNGAELAAKVLVVRPRCRVLYISGYAGLVGLAGGRAVLQKPFSPDALARAVREQLDRSD